MSNQKTLAERIYQVMIDNGEPLTFKEINEKIPDKPQSTIRGRVYENIGKIFKKIARGVYWVENEESACVVIEADGRKEGLKMLDNESVNAIVTDHPWLDSAAHKGGNRNFTNDYSCFRYTLDDFQEKARVLKNGAFLVEIVPAESATNYEYLYEIKQMAKHAGFNYYAKVSWKKGKLVANTGRKAKNTEDVLFFTKGKPRQLRPDKKKIMKGETEGKMSGTAYMLPTCFDVEPPSRKERIHQAEKPVELYNQILEAITLPGEIVVDQFAGSGALGASVLSLKNRIGILFESLKENVDNISKRLHATSIFREKAEELKTKENLTFVTNTKNVELEQMELALF
ncbi:DNA methyltransferase [Virgibacillus halodenitrificans]|uniref:DNA methyltransferase n=1 Tax=Virgibacillus halodenitrificans TaxID=1482 RepID=UPI001F08E91E|nr:DNA methyltransferase [Virgibacillus halodenitrificans]